MTSHVVSDGEGEFTAPPGGRVFTSVCSAISSHAAVRPDHLAVVDEAGRLTCAALWRRSGRLAARLAEAGVGAGSCVGIFLERSAEFVVAALAVLRTGAAYLPLDVATPADRLAFILDDAGAAVVVTRGAARLPA